MDFPKQTRKKNERKCINTRDKPIIAMDDYILTQTELHRKARPNVDARKPTLYMKTAQIETTPTQNQNSEQGKHATMVDGKLCQYAKARKKFRTSYNNLHKQLQIEHNKEDLHNVIQSVETMAKGLNLQPFQLNQQTLELIETDTDTIPENGAMYDA